MNYIKFVINFKKIIISFIFALVLQGYSYGDIFYQLGIGYSEGNSQSSTATGSPYAGNIEGYKTDFGVGLTSKFLDLNVDYILQYSPIGNGVKAKNFCANPRFTCGLNFKDNLELGAKFFLPMSYNETIPAIYIGVANADIELKSSVRSGAAATTLYSSHDRIWGKTIGASLNRKLQTLNFDVSLDYTWTTFEEYRAKTEVGGGVEEITTAKPEIHLFSLKLKKYF